MTIKRRQHAIVCGLLVMLTASIVVAARAQSENFLTCGEGCASLAKPQGTREDDLNLQIVLLKAQLAQSMSATAKCEAEGPQSAKAAKDAQDSAQALLKSLDERGLTIDQNKIIAKPEVKK